jgi:tetratricopeptide (TPR) repeat protein
VATNRLEILKSLVGQNPKDTFARYGLAMEYARAGNPEQAAAEYRTLLDLNPDYVAAYFQGGQVLEKLGRLEEARAMYQRGIEAAGRTGDAHARSELENALDMISE